MLGLLASVPLNWKDQAVVGALLAGSALVIHQRWSGRRATMVMIGISIFSTARYTWFRISETARHVATNGAQMTAFDIAPMLLLLGAEAYAFSVLLLGYFQSIRPLGRRPEPLPEDAALWPTVDILIPTFNEPLEVIRPTVLAALRIDWPQDRMRVYVLDDGRRGEVQDFAEQCGAGYITRGNNLHAKAGNINNALRQTSGEFVAVFDADHIATRSFLQMTMGWFLRDARLAMVQTPHHFYSPDPFERNLNTFRKVPNEGALFYGLIQDGNDFWNAAFFCGSCAVLRRAALDEIGGVAVETVTEDAHTALRLQARTWNTAYIGIPQAAGLATNTLADHIRQRTRWARGMVQILRIEMPLFKRGLTLAQRLCYFNSVIYFLYALPRLVFLTSPLVYLLLGRSNLAGYVLAILAYVMPHLTVAAITNSRIQGRWRFSFWNEVYETVLAPYILAPTLAALINPRWGRFNVTPKRKLVSERYFDWRIASPLLVLLGLNIVGAAVAIPRLAGEGIHFWTTLVNLVWVGWNTLIIGAALAVSWEARQVRSNARVAAAVPFTLLLPGGRAIEGQTENLSEGGVLAHLARPCPLTEGDEAAAVFSLPEGEYELPVIVAGNGSPGLRLAFGTLTLDQQQALTRLVYTRADSWLDWDKGCGTDRPLGSLVNILALGFRGLLSLPAAVAVRPRQRPHPETQPVPRRQPALPLIVVALLFLFAWRAFASDSPFSELQDLRALGHPQALVLRKSEPRTVYLRIPITKVVRQATLVLHYRASSALSPASSQILISLNGTAAGAVTLAQNGLGPNGSSSAQLALPADLLMSDNALTFQLAGTCAGRCTDASIWTRVEPTSQVQMSGSMLSLANDLRLLPAPFFDRSMERRVFVPVVFSEPPDAASLQAAGVVASWFGLLADHRGAGFPVQVGQIPAGDVVLVSRTGSRLAAAIGASGIRGAAVALRDNPGDPYGKVLAILGDDGEQVLRAARALASGQVPKEGDCADVGRVSAPAARVPYDAPRWLNTDRVVPLGDYATVDQYQVYGSGAMNLYFRLPPDLYYGSRDTVPLILRYRYAGVAPGAQAEMRVKLNNREVGRWKLAPAPSGSEAQRQAVYLPVTHLFTRNTLTVEFSFPEPSAEAGEYPEATLLRSSELDLRGVPRFAAMPRLELFANAGFPFTRLADLSQTAVVMPRHPSPEQIGLYLEMLGWFAAQTGYPALRVAVLEPGKLAGAGRKDLLIIGTAEDQPLFQDWAREMPVRTDAGLARLSDADEGWQRFLLLPWTRAARERARLVEMLSAETAPEAIIEQFESPLAPGRCVVAIATAHPRRIEPLTALLAGSADLAHVYGSVSVLRNGRFHSFLAPARGYHLGQLSAREAFDYWVGHYFWLIPAAVLLAALALAAGLDRRLERRARVRLGLSI